MIQSILLMYVSWPYGYLPRPVTLGVDAPDQGSDAKNEKSGDAWHGCRGAHLDTNANSTHIERRENGVYNNAPQHIRSGGCESEQV